MKRIKLTLCIVICSTGFLLVQLLFFRNVSKQRQQAHKLLPRGRQAEDGTKNLKEVKLGNIEDLIGICSRLGLSVFLIDPHILSSIVNNSTTRPSTQCRYLCHEKSLISLGVISTSVIPQSSFLDSLSEADFQTLLFQEADPRLSSLSTSSLVTTHILLHKLSHFIHLVVFYERIGNFLWHGSISWDKVSDQSDIRLFQPLKNKLSYGLHHGAYDKMDLVPVSIDTVKMEAPKYPVLFLDQIPHSRFIECNHTRAQMFHKKYGTGMSEEGKVFWHGAKDLLSRAKKVLDELGMRFWMSSGTCLGWFRQCDIIPYSKDVDLGMWIKDYDIRLIPAMQMSGMSLIHLFGKESDSFELSFHGGNLKLDMFFFYEEGDTMWNGGTQARTGKKYKYIFPRFSLCWTEFLEMKIRVPCETESYIEANYGKDWFTPVKHWDWKKSPPNVRENGVWPEQERKKVIRLF